MQTGPIFGGVLALLLFLSASSLLSVVSYSALILLTVVAAAKIYAFVMIKMGKMEPGFDPLAAVSNVTLTLPAVEEHAPCVTSGINQVLAKAKSLFLLENPVSIFKSQFTSWSKYTWPIFRWIP